MKVEWKDYSSLRPLGNRILVKRLSLPDVRESGLYIIGRDYPTMGRVLAVGNGTRTKIKYCLCGLSVKKHAHGPRDVFPAFISYRRPVTDIAKGDFVQWSIDSNFDLKQIGRTADGEDLFLFDYDDLNFVGREE